MNQSSDAKYQPPDWQSLVDEISNETDTDFVLFSGSTYYPAELTLMAELGKNRSRKNISLILTTFGGSADCAYRIGRALRTYYGSGCVTVFIPAQCKSAGTLITLAADDLVMTDLSELGPLDVQLVKQDEVGERLSGLTPTQALTNLRGEAYTLFDDTFKSLRRYGFSTRLAASISARMSVGLLKPIYAQIDPMRLGESQRAMMIAADYGERLKSKNVKSETIPRLLRRYPSHEFVIDRNEAAELFNNVRAPTDKEWKLAIGLLGLINEGQELAKNGEMGKIVFLSAAKGSVNDQSIAEGSGTGTGDYAEKSGEVAGASEAQQPGDATAAHSSNPTGGD